MAASKLKTAETKAAPAADKDDISPGAVRKLLDRFRVVDGGKFRLAGYDPGDTCGHLISKEEAGRHLVAGVERLSDQSERLYAQDRWAMLCVFQAMDAAGKDGTIKHVMSRVNPQGVDVTSFKAPGSEALEHDFLWRANRALPERGKIGIFNRSHYEDVLVVRVHPELLQKQRLPRKLITKRIWKERLEAIAGYERYLARQGTIVLKFFLHLSREEQKRRFLSRLDEREKNWKFNSGDIIERGFWDEYQHAYQHAIRATARPHAPWYVVPADNKWFTRLIVVAAMNDALGRLDLRFPVASAEERARLDLARTQLAAEKERSGSG